VAVRSKLPLIFCLGLAFGIPSTFLFKFMPAILVQQVGVAMGSLDGKLILVFLLILSALFSVPASMVVNKLGVSKSLGLSIVVVAIAAAILAGANAATLIIVMAFVFTAAYALLSVSSLPLAISMANNRAKVFCVGIFFSGVALPEGVMEAIQAF
jgi:hypothetical protein